ncbi:transcriptional regulator [Glutamicibacter sp. X7]
MAASPVIAVDLQRALFSPPRFKTLGFLTQVEMSDYPSIQEFTGLSLPEVSRAVGFLDEHGLVHVRKIRNGRYAQTEVAASEKGLTEFRKLLKEIKKYGAHMDQPS